jgi:amino-acid N-acetyltransferase
VDILPARTTDEQAIKRLLTSADLPVEDISAKSLEHFLVIHNGDDVVGVIGLDLAGDVALLRSLAVADTKRDRGLGHQLVVAAETLAMQCGVRDIYLLTTTADRYFAAHGYKVSQRAGAPAVLAEMPQFKSLCPSTSTLMSKRL